MGREVRQRRDKAWHIQVAAAGKWLDLVNPKEEARGPLCNTDDTAIPPSLFRVSFCSFVYFWGGFILVFILEYIIP